MAEQGMLLTKSSHWQYEREWRMFETSFNSDDNQPVSPNVWGYRLEPETVERVVLGSRIEDETKLRIMVELEKHEFKHVVILQAVLDSEEFEIKHTLIREGQKSR
jgi:hypothetical protein